MMPFFYMNPTFSIAYIRYEAPFVNYDALYNEAFAQIGERFSPIENHFRLAEVFAREMVQARAYNNLLHSALGFEPTEHSDAPPYIPTTPTTKPKPCIDFGFEPTEASE
jgi:hypothetical protein